MKKLLHLYNIDHNPFPNVGRGGLGYHLGKGGLGYHLPQYRKTIHGGGRTGDESNYGSDSEEVVVNGNKEEEEVEQKTQEVIDAEEIYNDFVEEDGDYYNLDKNDKMVKLIDAIGYFSGNKELQEPFLDLLNDLKKTSTGEPLFYLDENDFVSVNKDFDFDIDEILPTEEIEKEVTEKVREISLYYNQNINWYFKGLKDDIEKLIKKSKSSVEKKLLKEKLNNVENLESELRTKYKGMPTETELRTYLSKKKNLTEEEKNILRMYNDYDIGIYHEEQLTEAEQKRIEGLVTNMDSLPLDEQYKINLVEYDILIDYHNKLIRNQTKTKHPDWTPKQINEECSGKGYENYLCTTGKSLIDKNTNSTSPIINNDDNQLIPSGLRKYASIDLFNDVAMIECKEYSSTSSTDEIIPLQYTKLCGYNPFKIVFNENGKIVEFSENDKNILPSSSIGRDYKVYYRLNDGVYMYNVSDSIRNYTKKLAGGQKNARIIFDESDIKTGKLGSYKYDDGTRLKDHNGSFCINIKKKYLHKII